MAPIGKGVWDAISDTPQETASMKARSKLMMALSVIISKRQLRQKDAAALFGVTQPRAKPLAARGKRPVSAAWVAEQLASRQHLKLPHP